MKERHHRTERKHPNNCTCTSCQSRRVRSSLPKVKKKRKPKSQRGKPSKKQAVDSAMTEVLEILNLSERDD